jgi:hypothetical protein
MMASQSYGAGGSSHLLAFSKIESGATLDGRSLTLIFPSAPGTYACDGGQSPSLSFQESRKLMDNSKRDVTYSTLGVGTCTLTVTASDADAGRFAGTFQGEFLGVVQSSPQGVNDAGVQLFNGRFDSKP